MRTKIISILALLLVSAFLLSSCTSLTKEQKENSAMYLDSKYALPESYLKYWCCVYKASFFDTFGNDDTEETFLSKKMDDGQTFSEYIKSFVIRYAENMIIAEKLFDDYKLKLDATVTGKIEAMINSYINDLGSSIALDTALAKFGITTDELRQIYTLEAKNDILEDYLFGENGAELPDVEKTENFYRENYMLVNFITVYTNQKLLTDDSGNTIYDDDGNPMTAALTADEKAAKQKMIDEIDAAIKTDDFDFDALIEKYSEADTSDRKSGFIVSPVYPGVLDTSLVAAASKINEGEVTKYSSGGATFFILRSVLPDISELDAEQTEDLSNFYDNLIITLRQEKYDLYRDKITEKESLLKSVSIAKCHNCRKYVYEETEL